MGYDCGTCTYALLTQLHDLLSMFDHELSRHQLLEHIHRLAATDFSPRSNKANMPVCQHQGDPRWRVMRNGAVRLPLVPGLALDS